MSAHAQAQPLFARHTPIHMTRQATVGATPGQPLVDAQPGSRSVTASDRLAVGTPDRNLPRRNRPGRQLGRSLRSRTHPPPRHALGTRWAPREARSRGLQRDSRSPARETSIPGVATHKRNTTAECRAQRATIPGTSFFGYRQPDELVREPSRQTGQSISGDSVSVRSHDTQHQYRSVRSVYASGDDASHSVRLHWGNVAGGRSHAVSS